MKNKLPPALLLWLFTLILGAGWLCPVNASMWTETQIYNPGPDAETDPNQDNYTSTIVLDSNGRPHTSHYYLSYNGYSIAHLYQAVSGDWNMNQFEYWDNRRPVDFDLDSNNNPYFVYPWNSGGLKIRLTYVDAVNSWNLLISSLRAVYPAIKLDSEDKFHIIYTHHKDAGGGIYYVYGASTGIITREVVDAGTGVASIALDNINKPHIAYYDSGSSKLKYAYKPAETWIKEIVGTAGNTGMRTSSIAIDANGRPHISYYDIGNTALKYAYKPAASWIIATIEAAGSVGQYNSIALDTNGKPHITYSDTTNFRLKYARNISEEGYWTNPQPLSAGLTKYDPNTTGFWYITTVTGEAGGPTAIALDAANRPHISYVDKTLTKRRYATLTR